MILQASRVSNYFLSSIFRSSRKDGGHRMILNLKTFNYFLKFKFWKLESIDDTLDLITENCYFGPVILKDAKYSIPIIAFTENF